MFLFQLAFLLLLVGAWCYSLLTVVAAFRYRAGKIEPVDKSVPISVLKPLSGAEANLEENLRSFFRQQYQSFEIIFAVRHPDDPALQVVDRLKQRFPNVPCRVIVTGEPPYPNAKVFSVDRMVAESKHDLLVMSDSDVRVSAGMLATLAAEFEDDKVDLLTCPYRAVPGPSFWSRLEAIGLNTEFLSGLLVARLVEGVKFAVGPTIAVRRKVIEAVGGFSRFKEYLAEDFVLGKLAAEMGYGVDLSSYVIEHHIGSQPLQQNLRHRLRWARSTRRSRPYGYLGQVFTYPLPLAFLSAFVLPGWAGVIAATAVLRALSAWAVAWSVLRDPLTRRSWWLLPFQDLLGFTVWIGGFFGNKIRWRDRTYLLLADGRFKLIR